MTRDSKLNQNQGRRRYSMQEHGGMDSGGGIGTHVLKKSAGCDYWKPSWKKTKTCVRIFPGLNPENTNEFDVYRVSTDHLAFGDWVRTYPCVRNFGDPSLTLLLYDPASEDAYDSQTNPCWILYRAIENACKDGNGRREWYPLREFKDGRGRKLSKPTKLALVQCAIFQHSNKDYFNPDKGQPPRGGAPEDRTVVFELSSSAAKSMFNLLEKREEDWKGEPEDWRQYQYGDIVDLAAGAYVWFYEKGTTLDDTKKNTPKSAFGGSRASGGNDDYDGDKGFDCAITPDFKGVPAAIPEEAFDIIKGKVKPWDDILQFYSHEEQAHLLNGCFPASAIMYAFREHPEWISSTTKRMAVGTKQVEMAQDDEDDDVVRNDYDDMPPRPKQSSWGNPAQPVVSKARSNVVQQDTLVPTEEIEDEAEEDYVEEMAEPVNAQEVMDQDEGMADEQFDAPPARESQPDAAVNSVKTARNRSAARNRSSKLR